MIETRPRVDISQVIDNSRVGALQIQTYTLCGLCLIMDGFDVQAMGYAAPAIVQEWKIPSAQLGPVFGAALFGVLWILNFMNLLNLYFLASWLPTVVKGAGYSTSTAVLAGTTMQGAGTIGAVGLGWLVRRVGFVPVLSAGFALACVSIALIGRLGSARPGLSLAMLFVAVFLAGLGIVGELFEGDTLNQVWLVQKALPELW